MLLFGYLGETHKLNKNKAVFFGFIPFFISFYTIYDNYAKHSELGNKVFKFLISIRSLYGIAALLDIKTKNICYNLLDIVSKNFYGLFIYYYIRYINGKNGLLGLI